MEYEGSQRNCDRKGSVNHGRVEEEGHSIEREDRGEGKSTGVQEDPSGFIRRIRPIKLGSKIDRVEDRVRKDRRSQLSTKLKAGTRINQGTPVNKQLHKWNRTTM